MTTSKKLDRKEFLTSTVAAFATVTLGGCGGSSEDDGGSEGGGSGGTSTGGTATGGAATGGTATGGAATGGSTPTGGTGGSGAGGAGGSGGTRACTNMMSMEGGHVHPLTIPFSDIDRGYQDAPYILQEGGTGHTHTLVLDPYEFVYLNAGVQMEHVSSTDAGHAHTVTIDCPL